MIFIIKFTLGKKIYKIRKKNEFLDEFNIEL